ncbi:hypothetical protein ACVGWX_02965, partial [Enterobacter hormaechei]
MLLDIVVSSSADLFVSVVGHQAHGDPYFTDAIAQSVDPIIHDEKDEAKHVYIREILNLIQILRCRRYSPRVVLGGGRMIKIRGGGGG